jgi:hypothetical protein
MKMEKASPYSFNPSITQISERVFLRTMLRQLSGIAWLPSREMQMRSTISGLCTLMGGVFLKTMLRQ